MTGSTEEFTDRMSAGVLVSSDPVLAPSESNQLATNNERIVKRDRRDRSRAPLFGAEVITNLPNYYDLFGIDRSATQKEIDNAYRYCAKKLNPSVGRISDSIERDKIMAQFVKLNEAYQVLGNPKSRTVYDYYGAKTTRNGFINSVFDFREGVFDKQKKEDPVKFFQKFAHAQSGMPKLISDTKYLQHLLEDHQQNLKCPVPQSQIQKVYISLDELYNGAVKTISPDKGGDLIDLQILPGWTEGTSIAYHASGPSGKCQQAAPPIFEIHVDEHPNFRLEGFDLHTTVHIGLADAMGVGPVKVRHLDGRILLVNLTELIHPDTAKVLPGEGLPKDDKRETFGDLYVHFDVIFPEHVDPWQKLELWVALVESPLPKPPLHYAITPISQASFDARNPAEIRLSQGYILHQQN